MISIGDMDDYDWAYDQTRKEDANTWDTSWQCNSTDHPYSRHIFIMLLYLTQLSYLCLHLYVDIIAVKYATEIYFVLDNLAKSGLAQASVSRHCQVTQWSPLGGKHIASLGNTMATRMLGRLQEIKS